MGEGRWRNLILLSFITLITLGVAIITAFTNTATSNYTNTNTSNQQSNARREWLIIERRKSWEEIKAEKETRCKFKESYIDNFNGSQL